jgi:hypothetical protein
MALLELQHSGYAGYGKSAAFGAFKRQKDQRLAAVGPFTQRRLTRVGGARSFARPHGASPRVRRRRVTGRLRLLGPERQFRLGFGVPATIQLPAWVHANAV